MKLYNINWIVNRIITMVQVQFENDHWKLRPFFLSIWLKSGRKQVQCSLEETEWKTFIVLYFDLCFSLKVISNWRFLIWVYVVYDHFYMCCNHWTWKQKTFYSNTYSILSSTMKGYIYIYSFIIFWHINIII